MGQFTYYYLYGVERLALASGVKYFGRFDWFRSGASTIVNAIAENGDGGGTVDTCFKLMFLSRGRVPVWITKLQIPGTECNNRPNDIYFLNADLKGEVDWQFLDLDKTSAEELRSTPILYLASDQEIKLTPAQEAMLKRYLDLGGLLLANPDRKSEAFQTSIKRLAEKLYPGLKSDYLPADHLLFKVQHLVELSGDDKVWGLSNGARELILMPNADWGFNWQSEDAIKRDLAWRLAANLFVLATDSGVLESRLMDPFETHIARQQETGAIVVGRARYPGNWLPEPLAWDPLATRVFNRTGVKLTVTAEDPAKVMAGVAPVLDLDKIAACDYKLVHLTGTAELALTDAQKTAIKAYVLRGGTVLVESVGGSPFASSLEHQLDGLIDNTPSRSIQIVNPEEPILTGKNLPGGYENPEVHYRRLTAFTEPNLDNRPSLTAYFVNNRPAIIFSIRDLSLGLLDVRRWGINGYTPETARELMTNIVLRAYQQNLAAPGQMVPSPAGAATRPTASTAP